MPATSAEEFIPIRDTDEWAEFLDENREALAEIGDDDTLFRLACNCSLVIGGGAAPLFRVGFVDWDGEPDHDTSIWRDAEYPFAANH